MCATESQGRSSGVSREGRSTRQCAVRASTDRDRLARTMSDGKEGRREGSLEAPTRHALAWRSPEFTDATALDAELARVFDICHGCRRCFSLCNSFPTLFDAVDSTPSGELHDVPKEVYWSVVDHCYLCDMCYMTKCP